jgi:hypothetical protein
LSSDSLPEPAPQAAPLVVVIVIATLADFVVSVTEVAVIVNKGYAGTVAGAVKVTATPLAELVGDMVPHPGEQATPFCVKVHVTPAPAPPFAPSFVTVAVSGCVAFTMTVAEGGAAEIEMPRINIGAVALAPALVTEVATAAKAPNGGLTGAV